MVSFSQTPPSPVAGIDPRSFHVFVEEGKPLLFDRATAALLEISAPLFVFLQSMESGAGFDRSLSACEMEYPEIDSQLVSEMMEALIERGFFRYQPVDMQEQRRMIDTLWEHKPRRIQLLMAQSCNLGCRYCYAWRNGSNQKNVLMSWPVAKRAVDFLIERSGRRPSLQVTFFGGEPLLNYETIQKVVEYCESVGPTLGKTFTYELITNGTLLTADVTHFLAKHRFLLMVSIDGWQEMHEYNRPFLRAGDDYETIVANALYAVKVFRENRLAEIKVRANLTSKYHDSEAVRRHLYSLGFTKIGISPIEPLPHSEPSPSSMTDDQVDALMAAEYEADLNSIARLARSESLDTVEEFRLRRWSEPVKPHNLKGLSCGVNRNTAVVDTKGNIYPCHRYEGMENYIVGNVFTGMDYEKTVGYYLKVNGNATARCHSCWIRDYCAGGCAWLLSAKDGNLVDPTVRECDRRRKTMEHGLHLRARLRAVAPGWLNSENRAVDRWKWQEDEKQEGQCGSCNDCGEGCGS